MKPAFIQAGKRMFFAGLVPLLLVGCGSGSSSEISQQENAVPQSLQADGITWEPQSTMEQDDIDALSRYFQKNMSMGENTIVSGDPVVFQTKKSKRYYWFANPQSHSGSWVMLERTGKSFDMTEGDQPVWGEAAAE